jgi:hypothetical protein
MLFKKAEVTSAYLKMGVMGFAGSGKTYTATETAIGLVQHMRKLKIEGADKPIFFLDTETGSDWVKPKIEGAGIELYTAKTRAFTDLIAATKEAERSASVLLIDSITHFWVELCETYRRRKGEEKRQPNYRIQFQDWAYLKGRQGWGQFTDWYVNSPVHVILSGRAGYEYDYFENDEGKKELEKTGIKMKAESEMGFEPSLLVLMERHIDMETKKAFRTATVLKDRSTQIDGREIRDPKFRDFLPHINSLNLGGKQLGVDTSRTSDTMIPAEGERDRGPVQRRIVVDEIQTILTLHIPGQAAADKKRKIELLRKHFNAVWTEIEETMPLFDLRAGYDSLHRELEGVPSRYTKTPEPAAIAAKEPIDELPDHSAPPSAPETDKPKGKGKPSGAAFNAGKWLQDLGTELEKCDHDSDVRVIVRDFMSPKREVVEPETWTQAEKLVQGRLKKIGENILQAG